MKKLLLLLLLSGSAFATNYTVKSSGGSFTTISSCAATAVAGDTCTVYASASPQAGWTQGRSGSAGSLIRFTVNSGDTVVINSQVDISSRSYIQIDHFSFTPAALTRCVLGNGTTSHNVIDSNSFNKCSQAFRIADGLGNNGSDNVFSNNTDNPNDSGNNVGLYLYGDRNRIENNVFTATDGDCMDLGGTNVVVRNNICKTLDGTSSGQHIDFVQVIGGGATPTLVYSLIENNTELSCANDSANCHFVIFRTGGTPGAQGNIVRFNFASGLDAAGPVSFGGVGDTVPDNWLYNNTIGSSTQYAGNGSCASWQNAATGGAYNNICYNVQTASSSWSPFYDFSAGGLTENGNLVYTPAYAGAMGSPYSTEATYASLHSVNPLFANYPTDASIQSGSPARLAGVKLTSAVGAGASSTSLTVGNAHPFQQGWAGTNADWIRIGSSTTVQISSINYSTNVITLANAVSWSNGDAIYLYKDSSGNVKLNGATPDVGSYQYSTIPTPPTTSKLFANLQNVAGNPGTWTICNANTSCAAGTPSGVGSASVTFGNASPSKSGASILFTNTTSAGSPTGFNTLVYRHLSNSWTAQDGSTTVTLASISNTLLDEWVYVTPSATGIVGPEWDPDFYVGHTWTYKASIACYASAAKWYVYDQSIQNWRQTNLACDWNTTGKNAWHHIRLWVTLDQTAHQYTYQTLEIDGVEIFNPSNPPTITGAASPTFNGWNHDSGDLLNLQFQLDQGSAANTSTENLDQMNFYVWGTNAVTYTATVTKSGAGTGTVSGGTISCGATCSQSGIASGTTLTMSQSPTAGSQFSGWGGTCGCTGTSTCTPTITSSCTITAAFSTIAPSTAILGGTVRLGGTTIIK